MRTGAPGEHRNTFDIRIGFQQVCLILPCDIWRNDDVVDNYFNQSKGYCCKMINFACCIYSTRYGCQDDHIIWNAVHVYRILDFIFDNIRLISMEGHFSGTNQSKYSVILALRAILRTCWFQVFSYWIIVKDLIFMYDQKCWKKRSCILRYSRMKSNFYFDTHTHLHISIST